MISLRCLPSLCDLCQKLVQQIRDLALTLQLAVYVVGRAKLEAGGLGRTIFLKSRAAIAVGKASRQNGQGSVDDFGVLAR